MQLQEKGGIGMAERDRRCWFSWMRAPFVSPPMATSTYSIALNIFGNLTQEALTFLKPLAERFDEAVETLSSLRLS